MDDDFPKPEEIQKAFDDFINERFKGKIKVLTDVLPVDKPKKRARASIPKTKKKSTKEDDFQFQYSPKQIKAHLDRFVIGQDEAKKALAIAVCDHYMHIMNCLKKGSTKDSIYSKQNVLVLGPTGVGKTFLVKQIANLLKVPFVKADATKYSETGYMGGNVDDMVRDLVHAANYDVERAEFGIIYIDEIDKLATAQSAHLGKDVNGRGVQLSLLKMMEDCEIDLRSGHDPVQQMQAFVEIQQKGRADKRIIGTKFILFIVSGAFSGLDEIVARRLKKGRIGFSDDETRDQRMDSEYLLAKANTSDFIKFGFEPEFIGRLPVRVACKNLTVDMMLAILKDSESSILNQYRESFASYGIELTFEDDALRMVCELATEEKTGARGLMTILEKSLREFKFELPQSGISSLVFSPELMRHPQQVLETLLKESKARKIMADKLQPRIGDIAQQWM